MSDPPRAVRIVAALAWGLLVLGVTAMLMGLAVRWAGAWLAPPGAAAGRVPAAAAVLLILLGYVVPVTAGIVTFVRGLQGRLPGTRSGAAAPQAGGRPLAWVLVALGIIGLALVAAQYFRTLYAEGAAPQPPPAGAPR